MGSGWRCAARAADEHDRSREAPGVQVASELAGGLELGHLGPQCADRLRDSRGDVGAGGAIAVELLRPELEPELVQVTVCYLDREGLVPRVGSRLVAELLPPLFSLDA